MSDLYIGLISGTSVDAVDAVLADLSKTPPTVIASHETPIPPTMRAELLALAEPGGNEIDRMAQLDNTVARLFAETVAALLRQHDVTANQVRAVGSHGQTIRHGPQAVEPYTVQIGNPSLLAELTGITTVADFRRRDMAAGGQGAPLAPAFHSAFLGRIGQTQAVVNIGGIANITVLPALASDPVTGFDTGPGNTLMNAWSLRHLGEPFDHGGSWARQGRVLPQLLTQCLGDAYFGETPPKSTGPEHFNLVWLQQQLDATAPQHDAVDVQATLLALTVDSIAHAIKRSTPAVERAWICGGGVHNDALMNGLAHALAPISVASSAAAGLDPDYVEALGFAWLAQRTLAGETGNLPAVTGATGTRVLGGVYLGSSAPN